jgi:O-antigen/teichoic acid export membrane protein
VIATLARPAPPVPAALLHGAARGGIANLVGTGFTGVAGIAVTWLVARALTPAAAGAFFSATATFVLGTAIAKLGSQTSMVYWPARLRAQGDRTGLLHCLRVGILPVAAASVVTGAVLWFGADRMPGGGHGQFRVLAVFLPAAALSDTALAATRGFRMMRPTVVLDRIARPALQLALLGVLAVTGTGSELFAAAWAVPYVPFGLLAGYALARLAHREPRTAFEGEPFSAAEFWRFSAPRAVASTAQMALQRVDVLLVAALAGLAPAALYAVAGKFIILGQFVNQALSQSVQPRLAERLAVGDKAGANALYRQTTAWLVLGTWPMYFLVVAYAHLYLGLFGARYSHGAPIVAVLAGAMLVATACGMVDMVLAMGGRTWWNLANVGLALAVMLVVDAVLVPSHGALGAAVGLASAVLANNLVPLAQVSRGLGLHPFGRATLAAMGLSTGCFAVPPLLLHTTTHAGLTAQLAATSAGAAAYLLGVSRLRAIFTQGAR